MSDDRGAGEERSLLGRIAQAFSSEPRSRDDLREILQVAMENDIIDADALSIIDGAMQVSGMQARDIMVPRPQMEVIKAEHSLEEILPQIVRSAHSRYPVIGESPDDVLGILLVKDLLPQILADDHEDFDIRQLLRQSVVVPESKRLNVLLREFRENRNHMAIVIDEYFEVDLSDDEFDTIGGLVMHAFGHMPTRNEVTHIEGFEFKVINADQRKIHSLRLRPPRDE